MHVLFLIFTLLFGFIGTDRSEAFMAPSNVAVNNVGEQKAGSITFYSSTQLEVTWTPSSGETIDHYVIMVTDDVTNRTTSTNATANAIGVILNDLKAATGYSVTVKACGDSMCNSAATSSPACGSTSEEYWQLQGSGKGYENMTKNVAEGSVLSWVMRWGKEAGANAGKYQYFYKTNSTGREGIAMATTIDTGMSTPQIPFTPITTSGLRSSCSDAPDSSTTGCPAKGAYAIGSLQAVPMMNGKIRAFFNASDMIDNKSTRIYSLDSLDGFIGQDFHSGDTQAYCGGIGSDDYAAGGACEPTLVIGIGKTSPDVSPLFNARQFKIGYDWNKDWRWDGASGAFMIITGDDTCNKYPNSLFYATWNGSTWSVIKDSSNCAKPLVPLAHGPVLVPRGNAAYKFYYEDATNGQTSGKPLRLLYGDGTISGDPATVDFEDWENISSARQVNFLWPDGSLLDAQDEAGLGDHMILTPTGKLDKQLMFVNLGGIDNIKWSKGSCGLGMAILLNFSDGNSGSITNTLTTAESDCLFNWAEDNYPYLFSPSRPASLTSSPYYFRYYSGTNTYLGYSSADDHLYFIGPDGALIDLGVAAAWVVPIGCR